MAAATRPQAVLARRPTTLGATDAWAAGVEPFLLIRLVINNNGGLVVREGTHTSIIMTQFGSASVAGNRFTSSEEASTILSDMRPSLDQAS
jgi:hypothetical protein